MVTGKKILIVDDEEAAREVVVAGCQKSGYQPIEASSGSEALTKFHETHPDLVILDLNLPGVAGFDICRQIRNEGHKCPIIMVTGRTDVVDTVVGLELGADDYVAKPFEVRELMARVSAQLRRYEYSQENEIPQKISVPGMDIDLGRRQVFVDDKEVLLTLTEFNLLALLANKKGQVMSRGELLRRVWGYENDIETRTVDAHVYRLRRKVEKDPQHPVYIEDRFRELAIAFTAK